MQSLFKKYIYILLKWKSQVQQQCWETLFVKPVGWTHVCIFTPHTPAVPQSVQHHYIVPFPMALTVPYIETLEDAFPRKVAS